MLRRHPFLTALIAAPLVITLALAGLEIGRAHV